MLDSTFVEVVSLDNLYQCGNFRVQKTVQVQTRTHLHLPLSKFLNKNVIFWIMSSEALVARKKFDACLMCVERFFMGLSLGVFSRNLNIIKKLYTFTRHEHLPL